MTVLEFARSQYAISSSIHEIAVETETKIETGTEMVIQRNEVIVTFH